MDVFSKITWNNVKVCFPVNPCDHYLPLVCFVDETTKKLDVLLEVLKCPCCFKKKKIENMAPLYLKCSTYMHLCCYTWTYNQIRSVRLLPLIDELLF